MIRLYAYIAAFLVAALLGVMGLMVYLGSSDCRKVILPSVKGAIGGPFELVQSDGQTVTDKDVITKPSLVYFGYTYCPDVCPTDSARNAEAVDILAEKGFDVAPVFISIDPERDTPEVVGEYAGYMHEKMIGLTGSAEQVKAASRAYKMYYKKAGDDEHYLVDHSTFTYLVLPDVGFVKLFTRDVTPQKMAKTVACYAGAS